MLGLLLFAVLFQLADLAGDLVALVSQVVAFGLELSPLFVDVENSIEIDSLNALLFDGVPNFLGVFAEILPWNHCVVLLRDG